MQCVSATGIATIELTKGFVPIAAGVAGQAARGGRPGRGVAVMTGAQGFTAIAAWAADSGTRRLARLGMTCGTAMSPRSGPRYTHDVTTTRPNVTTAVDRDSDLG